MYIKCVTIGLLILTSSLSAGAAERAALVQTYEQARQSVETYPQAIYALHELMHIDLNHQSPNPKSESPPPEVEPQDPSPKTQAASAATPQPETPNSQPETGNWKPETHPDSIRLSYLAKLRPLYAGLVTDRPSQLRYGVGLADVLNESAMLRREQLLRTLRDGRGDPLTMFREAEAVFAEGREAAKVLGDTLTRGRGLIERHQRDRPDLVDRHTKLIEQLAPLLTIYQADERTLTAEREAYLALRLAWGRYDREANQAGARHLAMVYGVMFDEPELTTA